MTLVYRIWDKLCRVKLDKFIKKQRKKLNNSNFTIISQNCIGGVFYHDMQMQFLSPTINLFFMAPDFIKFVTDIKHYIDYELIVYWDRELNYPIGKLDDIQIYFMHYKTCEEAYDAWTKRSLRINFDKIIILSTDNDGFSKELYLKWIKIDYPKVLFTKELAFSRDNSSIYYQNYENRISIPDLIPKREFYKNDKLINTINEL